MDTIKYSVAEAALQAGATIINDISGLEYDVRLAKLAEQYSATLI
ncbi:MAG: dihydropteroate synthase [Ignavibacteria bacterium]|nr:dihydropteroate synthase [Ignavibacteria bacterium]